jgi:hypothetical protein
MNMKQVSMSTQITAMFALMVSALPASAAELTAGDITSIQQLYARYNTVIDNGDGEAWANTFTADGVFAGNIKGHDALVGFVKNWKGTMGGATRRHFSADLVVTPSAEGATGTASALLIDFSTKPVSIMNSMTYNDVLVKTAQGWRFKSRAIKADGAPAAPPAAAKPAAPAQQ